MTRLEGEKGDISGMVNPDNVSPVNQRTLKWMIEGRRRTFGVSKKELKSARRRTRVEEVQDVQSPLDNPFEVQRDPETGKIIDGIDLPESFD